MTADRIKLFTCATAMAAIIAMAVLTVPTKTVDGATVSPPRVELAANPGQSISGQFKLLNDKDAAQTFYLFAQDFEAKDETGNPQFLDNPDGFSAWITVIPSITLTARQEKIIDFSIVIPPNVEPGGYFAAIFASLLPKDATQATNDVAVTGRVGTLVFLRVGGDIPEGVTILEFGTKNKQRFFKELPVAFYYRFQNSGNDRVLPLGDIVIKNSIGRVTKILKANPTQGNVLPKSIRRFETAWTVAGGTKIQGPAANPPEHQGINFWAAVKYQWHNFALGLYTAHLGLAYGNVSTQTASDTFRFFMFPWQLMVILAAAVMILFILLRWGVKRYNKYIIHKARI